MDVVVGGIYRQLRCCTEYKVICIAHNADAPFDERVVYECMSLDNPTIWIRSYTEFTDGRFERVDK